MEHYIFMAAATMFVALTLSTKDGPSNIFYKFRIWVSNKIGTQNNPFLCRFCSLFWVYLFFLAIEPIVPEFKYFFGTLGLAAALVGASQEYS